MNQQKGKNNIWFNTISCSLLYVGTRRFFLEDAFLLHPQKIAEKFCRLKENLRYRRRKKALNKKKNQLTHSRHPTLFEPNDQGVPTCPAVRFRRDIFGQSFHSACYGINHVSHTLGEEETGNVSSVKRRSWDLNNIMARWTAVVICTRRLSNGAYILTQLRLVNIGRPLRRSRKSAIQMYNSAHAFRKSTSSWWGTGGLTESLCQPKISVYSV